VPLSTHLNDRGIAKVDLGVARGKKKRDKRERIQERTRDRRKTRLSREHG
jgi:SsrA-binding protein